MRIKKIFSFAADEASDLVEYLNHHNITWCPGEIINVVEMYEDDSHWETIANFVQKYGFSCRSETIFSKEELDSAQWLRIWCQWRCGYPQPEGTFITDNATYSYENRCPECGIGEVQIAPFRMKKEPNWGKRHFAELNWVGDELFLSQTAKSILEKSCITGANYLEVTNKKATEAFKETFQLVAPYILENGLVEELSNLRRIATCPLCGHKKYLGSGIGMKAYKKEIFTNAPDIVKTAEFFGADKAGIRLILVRQKVYQVLCENNLQRGLVFEPIRLV